MPCVFMTSPSGALSVYGEGKSKGVGSRCRMEKSANISIDIIRAQS